MIITDPPWGVGFDEYDNFDVFLQVKNELYRVLKQDSWFVFFFTPKRIYDLQPYLEKFSYKWIIPYIFHGFSTARNPLGGHTSYSIIMIFSKGNPKIVRKRADIILVDELPIVEKNPQEPQFKSTFAVSALLSMFTKIGDLVLDPFAGYGSIPLVCELFGRRWIGIEIDPIKYEIAKKIISEKRVFDIGKMREEIRKRRQAGLTRYINKEER